MLSHSLLLVENIFSPYFHEIIECALIIYDILPLINLTLLTADMIHLYEKACP
jgi:hypothetical protein